MAEIKSTLDLVLERTRHMSLSAEEKLRQQRADFEKRLQGLLQQYADGALSADTFRDRMAGLQQDLKPDGPGLAAAVSRRIELDGDNQRWLDLLAALAPAAGESLREILETYRRQREDLFQAARDRLLAQLAGRGITGSAVVPNPAKDAPLQKDLAAVRRQGQARIQAIVS